MDSLDPFQLLEVPEDADEAAIKRAFRLKSKLYHPDTSSAPDTVVLTALIAARSILFDSQRRAAALSLRRQKRRSKLERAFDGVFKSIDENASCGTDGDQKKRPPIGIVITIPLEVAFKGGEVSLDPPDGRCASCDGDGFIFVEQHDCPFCLGRGWWKRTRGSITAKIECSHCRGHGHVDYRSCPVCGGFGNGTAGRFGSIKLPIGVPDGSVLQFSDRVEGVDLHVLVHALPHPTFIRDGLNLRHVAFLSAPEAKHGCRRQLGGVDGSVIDLTFPSGTIEGDEFQFTGEGMVEACGQRGDLAVVVSVRKSHFLQDAFAEVRLLLSAKATLLSRRLVISDDRIENA